MSGRLGRFAGQCQFGDRQWLGAQPEIWLNVALVGPDGKTVWESGYVDSHGDMADLLERWAPDAATRRRILVDNPRRLFRFS